MQLFFNFASCSAISAAIEVAGDNSALVLLQVAPFHFFLLYLLISATKPISGELLHSSSASVDSLVLRSRSIDREYTVVPQHSGIKHQVCCYCSGSSEYRSVGMYATRPPTKFIGNSQFCRLSLYLCLVTLQIVYFHDNKQLVFGFKASQQYFFNFENKSTIEHMLTSGPDLCSSP